MHFYKEYLGSFLVLMADGLQWCNVETDNLEQVFEKKEEIHTRSGI